MYTSAELLLYLSYTSCPDGDSPILEFRVVLVESGKFLVEVFLSLLVVVGQLVSFGVLSSVVVIEVLGGVKEGDPVVDPVSVRCVVGPLTSCHGNERGFCLS